jgi:hypothetical protein
MLQHHTPNSKKTPECIDVPGPYSTSASSFCCPPPNPFLPRTHAHTHLSDPPTPSPRTTLHPVPTNPQRGQTELWFMTFLRAISQGVFTLYFHRARVVCGQSQETVDNTFCPAFADGAAASACLRIVAVLPSVESRGGVSMSEISGSLARVSRSSAQFPGGNTRGETAVGKGNPSTSTNLP